MPPEDRKFCVRIISDSFPGLRYAFKSAARDLRPHDPDLGRPYDLSYETDDDGGELVSRLFTEQEALEARNRVHKMLKTECRGDRERVTSTVVEVDRLNPLAAFKEELRLLRLLPMWPADHSNDTLEEFSLAWSTSREDGLRTDKSRILFRRSVQKSIPCYEVRARLPTPGNEADVIARYGRCFENIAGPNVRLERFPCLEWDYPLWGCLTEAFHVTASRALTQMQANAVAEAMRSASEGFVDIVVEAFPLGQFCADEGLLPQSYGPSFANATDAEQKRCGFPWFLSMWRDDEQPPSMLTKAPAQLRDQLGPPADH